MKQWLELEQTPAYSVLEEREFGKQGFREPFRLAFNPSRKQQLVSALDAGEHRYLNHYADWTARTLSRFPQLTKAYQSLDLCTAAERATQFIPSTKELEQPDVALAIFAPDARGYDPIVLDLSLIETWPNLALQLLVAHEMHHHFRSQIQAEYVLEDDGVDAALFWALNQLQAEGVADLINMPHLLQGDTELGPLKKLVEGYQGALDSAPESINALDQIIRRVAAGTLVDGKEIKQLVREALPRAAHTTGYFMARTTLEHLPRAVLIEHVANPFAFLRDYQKAAKIAGSPRLSQATMRWVTELESRLGKNSGGTAR